MGFLKKLKETAEKSIEKGVELGTKGYDGAKEAATKGYEIARDGHTSESSASHDLPEPKSNDSTSTTIEKISEKKSDSQEIDPEALTILKMRLAKGEISKEEFEEMKSML